MAALSVFMKIISDENEKTQLNGWVVSCLKKEAARYPGVYIRRPGETVPPSPPRTGLRELVTFTIKAPLQSRDGHRRPPVPDLPKRRQVKLTPNLRDPLWPDALFLF